MSFYANPYSVMEVPNEYPLHFAARKGQYDSVRKLLKERFDPNALNIYGLTPLHLACQLSYTPIVKLLLDHQADKFKQEPSGPTPFQTAIYKGNLNVVQLLLEGEHIDVRDRGHTALHWAVAGVCPLLVAWLLQHKADPNARVRGTGKTPVHFLCGVCAFREPSSALAILKLLAKYGANLSALDAQGKMALHGPYNDSRLVKALVEHGVDVNATDREGKSALYYACGQADHKLVRWLLTHGAKADVADIHGVTPLAHAVRQGEKEIPRLLYQHGAKSTSVDRDGKNPLHALLTSYGIKDKEERALYFLHNLLLPGGGDVNAQTKDGWTALHYAVYYNYFSVVQALLQAGASVHVRTRRGYTALHLVGLKNYENGVGQEEKRIQQALDQEITRRTERIPTLPWGYQPGNRQGHERTTSSDNDEGDVDDDSVVSEHGLPWKVRNRAVYRLLLRQGADCTATDEKGDFPFFLSAATEWMDATFSILLMAARQGIFETKNQQTHAIDATENKLMDVLNSTTILHKKQRID